MHLVKANSSALSKQSVPFKIVIDLLFLLLSSSVRDIGTKRYQNSNFLDFLNQSIEELRIVIV